VAAIASKPGPPAVGSSGSFAAPSSAPTVASTDPPQRPQVVATFEEEGESAAGRCELGHPAGEVGEVTARQRHLGQGVCAMCIEARRDQHPGGTERLDHRCGQLVERPFEHVAGGTGRERDVEVEAGRISAAHLVRRPGPGKRGHWCVET